MLNSRLILAALLLIPLSCSKPPERQSFAGAPVVLISIDTLRADHLSLYGYRGVDTPNIDQLARDGITFDEAWSPCPMTLPSYVSMLAGELPTTHEVRNNLQ